MSATPGNSQKAGKLRVRINQIDYTLVPPECLDNSKLLRVPVIRIFGSSSTGQTACVHVHQVYPYLFIEYLGHLTPDYGEPNLSRYLFQLIPILSKPLHIQAISLSEPCCCLIPQTKSKLPKISVYPGYHSCQGY